MTSLFAAALAFHNVTWRYMFAFGREHVLPPALGRTGANNIPKAASLVQSISGLAVIVLYAATGLDPMSRLFFDLGTTGGFGILVLLALTSAAVVAFFARDTHGENAWPRLIAPVLAALLLTSIVALAVRNYATLLGVPRPDTVSWALPASYAVAGGFGLVWGWFSKSAGPTCTPRSGLAPTRSRRGSAPA